MKHWRTALLIAVVCLIINATPCLAVDPPDSNPSVSNIKVNRNLLEDGDALLYGMYLIPYATPPTEIASETYIIRLFESDVEIGVITPFVYFDRGYNKGVFAIYLEDGDWETTIPSWVIKICQSPAFFDPPDTWDFSVPSLSFTSQTTQEDNQTELAINIISFAEEMSAYYDEYTFLEDSPGGTVLSSPTGETYFGNAIYGLQAMAPSLFLVQTIPLDTTPRTWTTDEFDAYASRFEGTWVDEEVETSANQWGISEQSLMALLSIFPACIGAVVLSTIKYRRTEPGLIVSMVFILMGAIMGWFPLAIFATVFQLLAIYLSYVWFSSRAHHFMSFYTLIWFLSVAICLVIEGSALGTYENSVINDLSLFTTIRVGGLVPIPAPNIFFFRGLIRILMWDYSFYIGGYVYLKYLWMATLTPAVVWQVANVFAPVFANFLRWG